MALASVLPSAETSTPAPPAPPLPLNPPLQITSHHQVLEAKDVEFFNPDVPDEHGLGPVATVSSDTVYYDIYTWVERLKDLVHVHGPDNVKQIIQPCLRGSAATWWIAELNDEDRRKLRSNAYLQRWYSLLMKRFKVQTFVAIAQLTSQSYLPRRRVLTKIIDEILCEICKTRSAMLILLLRRRILANRKQGHRIGMSIMSDVLGSGVERSIARMAIPTRPTS